MVANSNTLLLCLLLLAPYSRLHVWSFTVAPSHVGSTYCFSRRRISRIVSSTAFRSTTFSFQQAFSLSNNIFLEDEEDEQDWLSDRELLRRAAQSPGGEALTNRNRDTLEKIKYAGRVDKHTYLLDDSTASTDESMKNEKRKKSVYTDEERELIQAMGGSLDGEHQYSNTNQREEGYLGDCTLREISQDYAVPICYLADVLMTWGVPPPISVDSQLGDLVTGEQAFALIEALTTLDNTQINERYSYDDLITLCDDYDLDLRLVFDFCMKEGYNLPFGVRTCLRVEQERELLRVMCEE